MKKLCYVCGVEVLHGVYIGGDLYRHEACQAGSYRWMQYQAALPINLRSPLYEDFLGVANETVKDKV